MPRVSGQAGCEPSLLCRLFPPAPGSWRPLVFPSGSGVKVSACNAGDPGSIPELGLFPGEGNGTPLQYSCLENPKEGGAW